MLNEFINSFDVPDTLRLVVLAVCLYNIITAIATLVTYLSRRKLDRAYMVKGLSPGMARVAVMGYVWAIGALIYICVATYLSFRMGYTVALFFRLALSPLFAFVIYNVFTYELHLLRARQLQVSDASKQAAIDETESQG